MRSEGFRGVCRRAKLSFIHSFHARSLVAFAQGAAALQAGSLSRRAAIVGVAGSLHSFSTLPVAAKLVDKAKDKAAAEAPPASAAARPDVEAVIERAKKGALTTDNVIVRALREDMLNPLDISSCEVIEQMSMIDVKAADEVRNSNAQLARLIDASKTAGTSSDALDKSLMIGTLVEQRITKRAQEFNQKFITDCMIPS